jgi:hypothetical protein
MSYLDILKEINILMSEMYTMIYERERKRKITAERKH